SIFKEGDMNMLIEVYHHVLKSHWLDGKCNWCIDHLVHTLVNSMEPDYQAWHRRQIVGLEGPNLIGQQCQEI
ncbi:hypothetical protein BJV74DRAFT_718293, partial [Russula compacta]